MTGPVRVLGFAGSLRKGSYNRAALRAAAQLAPPRIHLEPFDLAPIPLYDGEVEAAGLPESVQAFRRQIAAADALLIVTPEYNHSVSGVLKNSIDWASRPPDQPLSGKPIAIMGTTTGGFGTVRAQGHLRLILTALNMLVLPKPDVLIAAASGKFDADGQLTDEPARQSIRALLEALLAWTCRLHAR